MIGPHYEFDNVDLGILNELTQNAKTPFTEIASKLLVSPGTVHVRVKKMEDAGVISRFTIDLNPKQLGYDLIAFIGVYLDKGSSYDQVIERLKDIPEVVETYYTTGRYGIFVKVLCKNTDHMRDILHERFQLLEGVQRTETILSLEEGISRKPHLPGV